MRRSRKVLVRFLCIVMLLTGMQTCLVGAANVSPRYTAATRVTTLLQFSNNTAQCGVCVYAKAGTSKITGTIRLYDNTTNMYVGNWNVNKKGAAYIGSNSVAVKSGHQYTLSFTGAVYDTNGFGERISSSTTKVN